ncbi:MAG: transketolase family protein, partial [Thermoplasmata archaeon]
GIHDRFCESGEPKDLMEKYQLNAKHIAAKIERQLSS